MVHQVYEGEKSMSIEMDKEHILEELEEILNSNPNLDEQDKVSLRFDALLLLQHGIMPEPSKHSDTLKLIYQWVKKYRCPSSLKELLEDCPHYDEKEEKEMKND